MLKKLFLAKGVEMRQQKIYENTEKRLCQFLKRKKLSHNLLEAV